MTAEIGVLSSERRAQLQGERPGTEKEVMPWEKDDAPPGSTSESLLVFEGGRPVRVAGPTHYHQLADGRTLAGYSGGTHHDDGERVTRILGVHEG